MRCRGIRRLFGAPARFSFASDAIDFFFDGEFVEACKRKAEEKTYSPVEDHERLAKGFLDLFGRSFDSSRIGHAPMSRHGLTGPYGAYFLRGVVTHCENKIHSRSAGFLELSPILAAHSCCWKLCNLELMDGCWIHLPFWMASCAIGCERGKSFSVRDGLGHDRPRGISSAEEQDVVTASVHDESSMRYYSQ